MLVKQLISHQIIVKAPEEPHCIHITPARKLPKHLRKGVCVMRGLVSASNRLLSILFDIQFNILGYSKWLIKAQQS
jgi:hypothetical protein